MNEADRIEELSKEVNELRTRLNVVIIILAFFILLSLIAILQTITYPALQIFLVLIIVVAILAAILIYIDIHVYGEGG